MSDIALYYPDVFVQDETWLKAAALYWPRIARLMTSDYPAGDSRTARVLHDELDFFVDVDPEPYGRRVVEDFVRWLGTWEDPARRPQEAPSRETTEEYLLDGPPYPQVPGMPLTWPYRWIESECSGDFHLPGWVLDRGIAVVSADEAGKPWVRLERRLAHVYMTALARKVADANNMAMVTDQQGLPGHPHGWGSEPAPYDRTGMDPQAMYAVVALRAVLPRGLEDVPVQHIVEARRALADEFDAFRRHVTELADSFAESAAGQDPAVLRARMEMAADRDIRTLLGDLERGLRSQRLEPVRAVFSLKTPEVPIVLSVLGTTFSGHSSLSESALEAGAIAACFVSAGWRAGTRVAASRRSPAGYLLGLREELDPQNLIDRIRRNRRHVRVD
ncbi:DUF6236 family protein [Phaeacidiphilus oryzae]|uniref:DUF6236 family protein n=1 Tax=Phaeacidiphilus oryzae TaxID=348818 RepID=UPI00055ADC16|nr:DUF6236 family protein [Phaeacidiphilus oryzae]